MGWDTMVAIAIGSAIAATVLLSVPTEPCDWGNTSFFEEAMLLHSSHAPSLEEEE